MAANHAPLYMPKLPKLAGFYRRSLFSCGGMAMDDDISPPMNSKCTLHLVTSEH